MKSRNAEIAILVLTAYDDDQYVIAILQAGAAGYLAICALFAIMTSALTLASFIKFFGVSFLSRASSLVTAQAARRGRLEVGWAVVKLQGRWFWPFLIKLPLKLNKT